jgi:hypothetical protein
MSRDGATSDDRIRNVICELTRAGFASLRFLIKILTLFRFHDRPFWMVMPSAVLGKPDYTVRTAVQKYSRR